MMGTIGYQDPQRPEAAAILSALAGRTLRRVRALAAETLGGGLEIAEVELTFEGGPTLVIGLGAGGQALTGAPWGGPADAGGEGAVPPGLWLALGAMGHEADPSNPWQPVALDAHPVWRHRLGTRIVVATPVRGGEVAGQSLPGDPAGALTGVVFTFEDGRRVDVYDAGRCLHMVVLPEAPAPAGART